MYPCTLCPTSKVTNMIQVRCSRNQWQIQKYLYNNTRSTLIDPASASTHGGGNNLCSTTSLSLSTSPPLCISGTMKQGPRHSLIVRAISVPESADGGAKADSARLARLVQLGGMLCLWYLLNIYFNIYNKQVLRVYPFPSTITAFQFGCGSVLVLLMWGFNLHPKPKVTRSQSLSLTLSKLWSPSLPLFSLCSFLRPNLWVVFSLAPIVGGVALASFTEASFNWLGFCSAMASNLTNQSRNVLSKKLMVKEEEGLDNINLFSVITLICFIILLPTAILLEGIKLSPSYLQLAANQGLDVKELCVRALVAGLCFHTYQQELQ